MEINKVGSRYDYYYKFDSASEEYDYKHRGLLHRIMSKFLFEVDPETKEYTFNTKNEVLNMTLAAFEKSLMFVLEYIDRLKNFKNFTKSNR